MKVPSFDTVLRLALQLPHAERVRLVDRLDLIVGEAPAEQTGNPWEVLARLSEEFGAEGPVSPSIADELSASRR